MAHEIEFINDIAQFFAVGNERVWHGEGLRFDSPPELPSIPEKLDSFGATYSKVGLTLADTGEPMPDVFASVRTLRDGTRNVVGKVGPQFTFFQPADRITWAAPIVDAAQATLDTGGSLKNGARLFLSFRIGASDPVEIVPGDPVVSHLVIAGGYDGLLAEHVMLTPVRPVCQNTLSMAINSKATKLLRVKHSRQVHAAMTEIREIIDLANREFKATCEQYQSLAQKQVNVKDLESYVRKVFRVTPPKSTSMAHNAPEDSLTTNEDTGTQGKRIFTNILPLFESGRGNTMEGVRGTWWAAYNAVTEYLTHERGNNLDNRLDSLYFGQGASLSRKALDLAMEFRG